MAGVKRSRRRIKHPFWFAFIVFGVALCVYSYNLPAVEHEKLDYSKLIFTTDYAIICPQALFFDRRADHGLQAIYDAFSEFSLKYEKATALGCQEWRGGIPVHASRMPAPLNYFVAISPIGGVPGQLFTMEADLTNGDSSAPIASSEATKPATKELNPNETPEPYEVARQDFQAKLGGLEMPASNIRLISDALESDPGHLEMARLVTPYGPCATLLGNAEAGYDVGTLDPNPDRKSPPTKTIGSYASRDEARLAAAKYCQKWYETLKREEGGRTTQQLWFRPDEDSSPEPAEVSQGDDAPRESPSLAVESAARPPIGSLQPLKWSLQPNGDETLVGPSGICAIVSRIGDSNQVRLTLANEVAQSYSQDEMAKVNAIAVKRCLPEQ